jgi:hypothetical protein
MSKLRGRKIRIISSDHRQNWYTDKIGQEFIVHSECSRNRENLIVRTTVEQAGWPYGWVSKKDCVFVEEEPEKEENA